MSALQSVCLTFDEQVLDLKYGVIKADV